MRDLSSVAQHSLRWSISSLHFTLCSSMNRLQHIRKDIAKGASNVDSFSQLTKWVLGVFTTPEAVFYIAAAGLLPHPHKLLPLAVNSP